MTKQELQQIEAAKAALEIWQRFENSDISTMSDAEIKICVEQREIIHNSAPALVRRVQELEDENESLTLQIKELCDENAELAYMFDSYYKTTHDATRRFQGRIAELEDWQARVLTWLRRQQDYLKNKSDDYTDSSTSVNAKIDADELTALIAEVKE